MLHNEYSCISRVQTLPSRLVVDIGEWTVGDIASMGKRGANSHDQMLARCKVVSDEDGVYKWKANQPVVPEKLQTGDRSVAIIMQRIISHWRACGPFFDFSFHCDDEDCRDAVPKAIPWTVDLRRFLLTEQDLAAEELESIEHLEDASDRPVYLPGGKEIVWVDRFGDMPIVIGNADGVDKTAFLQMLSDEALQCWLNGNRFEYFDPITEKNLIWKIMIGEDEAELQKYRKSADKFRLNALGRRIVEVDGVQAYMKPSWINGWFAGAEDMLQQHINDVEPGMFREFDVRCPRCGLVQGIAFPLDMSFFSPSSRRKKPGRN